MPNRFTPINSSQPTKAALQQINNVLKGGNAQSTFGKLPNGRYGLLIYDDSGMPRILIGQANGDGRPGIWITKPGFNVLDEVK